MSAERSMNSKKKVFAWSIVFVYLMAMFFLSNQQGQDSNMISKGIVHEIRQNVSLPDLVHEKTRIGFLDFNFIIRKLAHFIEYTLLSLAVCFALLISGVKLRKSMIISFVLCFSYAVFDEYHQSFVIGRTSAWRDVIIDTLGVLCGLLAAKALRMLVLRFRTRRMKSN